MRVRGLFLCCGNQRNWVTCRWGVKGLRSFAICLYLLGLLFSFYGSSWFFLCFCMLKNIKIGGVKGR